jgi:hypothetical protein
MAGAAYSFDFQGLQSAYANQMLVPQSVAVPWGGETDVGGSYAKGLGFGLVGGTAQPEIWTITSSLADNTWRFIFNGGIRTYITPALAFDVTTAALKTALQDYIFGADSIATVTGTPGSSYVITFAENTRIGGVILFQESASSGSISVVRTQRGSVGSGQYDVYNNDTITTIDALNIYETALDPTGALQGEFITATGQPFNPPTYLEGFFYSADIPNIASGAVGNDKKLGYVVGSSVSAAGTVLRLSQKN